MRQRLLLLLSLATLLLLPNAIRHWLFNHYHWLVPFLIWALLIMLTAAAEWRHRHHEL
ncbi:hypothetical protein CLV44_12617 [Marinobacterium halophilum]|uniref:Uncharacterized protein n=1 Tax=Marinobacterium halophilum TaxID=267374 RepID=A0A2P8EM01_9GAMM|nr:hypothetical protein [Marinobacterium halophilum]PSL10505.1 hypothetical protein CLV44_12617 [Marinobacterium halophilum]